MGATTFRHAGRVRLGTALLALLWCLGFSGPLTAEELILRFAYGDPSENGEPPYYYLNKDGEFVGVVADILRQALSPLDVHILPVFAPRKRLMTLIERDEVDIDVMNAAWLPEGLPVVFSAPVYTDPHAIYARAGSGGHYTSFSSLAGLKICTHRGYSYSQVQKMMDEGQLIRIDGNTDKQMLKMLIAGRCNILVGPVFVIDANISELGIDKLVHKTALIDRVWELQFMLNKKHEGRLSAINRFLTKKDYPEIYRQIIARHRR